MHHIKLYSEIKLPIVQASTSIWSIYLNMQSNQLFTAIIEYENKRLEVKTKDRNSYLVDWPLVFHKIESVTRVAMVKKKLRVIKNFTFYSPFSCFICSLFFGWAGFGSGWHALCHQALIRLFLKTKVFFSFDTTKLPPSKCLLLVTILTCLLVILSLVCWVKWIDSLLHHVSASIYVHWPWTGFHISHFWSRLYHVGMHALQCRVLHIKIWAFLRKALT